MNTIISLNQIVKLFKDFTTNHPQLKSFGYGQTSDIGTSVKVDYPACWLTHTEDSTLQVLNKNIAPEIRFTVLFFDKINQQHNLDNVNGEAANNGQEILSDSFQYGQDLVNEIMVYWGQYGITINGDVGASPIMDETDDKVNGWQFNISIKLKHYNCAMQIGNVSIIHPTQIDFLTCDTLPDCPSFAALQLQVDDLIPSQGGGLTCATVGDCSTIQNIISDVTGNTSNITNLQSDIINIQNDIIAISGSTGPSSGLTCTTLADCQIIQDIQSDIIAISGSSSGGGIDCTQLSGCTIIQDIQNDIINIQSDVTGNTLNITNLQSDVSGNTANINNIQNDIVTLSGITSSGLTCNTLSGCTIIQTIQSDINSNSNDIVTLSGITTGNTANITNIQNDITTINNTITGLTSDYYIAVNFETIDTFTYVAPEGFKIVSIDNPSAITYTVKVDGVAHTLGDDILLYQKLTIAPTSIGFLKLNCELI